MDVPESIRKIEDNLNSRGGQSVPQMNEHELRPKEFDVKDSWGAEVHTEPKIEPRHTSSKFYFLFLLFSIIFFIGAGVYAYFSITGGYHNITTENIDIQVSGPVSIPGGEKLSLDVSITNKNRDMLKTVELIVEYPQGTRSGDENSVSLPTDRITIGDINPGETVRNELNVKLFGEEQTVSKIKMILEYRLPNSNSIYEKELTYEVALNSNPISISVDSPKETISGQPIDIVLNIASNATEKLHNVIVESVFPSGFSFQKSEPVPLENNRSWKLGDFAPSEKKKIIITGVLSGENQDARTFRFDAGIGAENNPDKIETAFAGYKQEIVISKPFLSVNLVVNGKKDSDVSVKPGDNVNVEVGYVNNLPITLRDVKIEIVLSGLALDESSVAVSQGFYQSSSNTILWSKETLSELQEIIPGASNVLNFVFVPSVKVGSSNADVKMSVNVTATRGDESGGLERFTNIVQKRVITQSNVALKAGTYYSSGPIDNIGGIPPKAEKPTTYTITWSLTNGANDILGSKVTALLPSYVEFNNIIVPRNELVSYDEVTRVVTWDIGTLNAGVGSVRNSKTVSFQVTFTPSISQIGTSPIILGQSQFTGEDRFGKVKSTATAQALTTTLADPSFRSGEEIVGQ